MLELQQEDLKELRRRDMRRVFLLGGWVCTQMCEWLSDPENQEARVGVSTPDASARLNERS